MGILFNYDDEKIKFCFFFYFLLLQIQLFVNLGQLFYSILLSVFSNYLSHKIFQNIFQADQILENKLNLQKLIIQGL
jgi:hypothetical protein